jgi:hypothetical protein
MRQLFEFADFLNFRSTKSSSFSGKVCIFTSRSRFIKRRYAYIHAITRAGWRHMHA